MKKTILYFSMAFNLFLCSCIQLNKVPADGDININLPATQSRSIFSSEILKEDILKTPQNAIYRLYLIDEKGFTINSTVGKPGGTAFFNNIKAGQYTLKCYYGLSASKINAVAAATKPVTVIAGETSQVELELTYNRSNLIEKVNVEWAGNIVYYGDPDYLNDDYVLENTLIDFYLSNGWNESFIANDDNMKRFCHIENNLIAIEKEQINDTSFLITINFSYKKTPSSEILTETKAVTISVINDPSLCPDWNSLSSRISSVPAGESATFKLISANYTADTQLSIPADTYITITTYILDVEIKPKNTSMDHLISLAAGANLTIDGGSNKITFNGRYDSAYTFTGALILADVASNLTIKNNIYFKNAATNSTTEAAAIAIKQSATCSISDGVYFDSLYSTSETLSMGGAITNAGELTITGSGSKNVVFDNCNSSSGNENTGGGAIFSYGDKLSITNAAFKNNCSFNKGGAIYISNGTNNTITGCTFTNNEASNGDNDIHAESGADYTRN